MSVYWTHSPVRLSFDIADQVRSGYTVSDMNRHRLVCSASASSTFCRNKCRVELSAEDFFNNSDLGTWTNISAYQRSTYNNYYFHHYFKLSFNYSFGSKSKKSSSKPTQSMTIVNWYYRKSTKAPFFNLFLIRNSWLLLIKKQSKSARLKFRNPFNP